MPIVAMPPLLQSINPVPRSHPVAFRKTIGVFSVKAKQLVILLRHIETQS